jgi:lipopolysaccharide biosynthesis protein
MNDPTSQKPRILVVAHVFYGEMWPELAQCIENIRSMADCDVFVTIPPENASMSDGMSRRIPGVRIVVTDDLGYDVLPFLSVLSGVRLEDYDLVAKVHSKRNVKPTCIVNGRFYRGASFRKALLSFCSTPGAVARALSIFRDRPAVGMVGSGPLILPPDDLYEIIYPEPARVAGDVLSALGLSCEPAGRRFVAGTMFMVRAKLLKPLQGRFQARDFLPEARDGKVLPYALERAFGWIVCAQGKLVAPISKGLVPDRFFQFRLRLLRRLLGKANP